MFNHYANIILSTAVDEYSMPYVTQQVNELLRYGSCALINNKDYQLEAAASAINGLTEEHETADIYLYAAIERKDWQEVTYLYSIVFRPHLYEYAMKSVMNTLNKTSQDII